jgi:5-methylcytosine-specific restriction endonuclease McrA
MKKNEFFDQYKDPRWQKKRLEILERDKFKCRSCTNAESTLHVHHFKYDPDCKVWEYDNDDLITFCDTCHEA